MEEISWKFQICKGLCVYTQDLLTCLYYNSHHNGRKLAVFCLKTYRLLVWANTKPLLRNDSRVANAPLFNECKKQYYKLYLMAAAWSSPWYCRGPKI